MAGAFVQSNIFSGPVTSVNSASCPYNGPQANGNLNIAFVFWFDLTSTIESVRDDAGNVYLSALGPTRASASFSVQTFYCAGIQPAQQNRVTVTTSASTTFLSIAVAEFSGMQLGSLIDTTGSGSGSSVGPATVTLTTANASDLLIGAAGVATGTLSAAGAGYTGLNVNSRFFLEYAFVSASGLQSATTATLTSTDVWVIQGIAFKQGTTQAAVPTNVITSCMGVHRVGLS